MKVGKRIRDRQRNDIGWQFAHNIIQLIWDYKWYSLAVIAVTILRELAALWPINLLGQFVDRLQNGNLGNIVWLLMGASLLYPTIVLGCTILYYKMYLETDLRKRVELILKEADKSSDSSAEAAGSARMRAINAASGIIEGTHHVLVSFTPVITKIIVVSGSLLAYNRLIGTAYVASLSIPILMTILFNSKLRVLRDKQYSVLSEASGAEVEAIASRNNLKARNKFKSITRERKEIRLSLAYRGELFLYLRQATLVGSQFLVVFLALGIKDKIGLTPGDFTMIVGYTGQVAIALISAVSVVDRMLSYSRAYHVFAKEH